MPLRNCWVVSSDLALIKPIESISVRDFIFSASKFNVGFVYRKFHRYSNKPLLNIQIGGSISFLNNPNKIHFEDSFRYSYSGSSYLLSGDKVNNVFPSIYIGIGNEWELNDKLFFSLNSRFQYGIMEVYKTEISRNAGTYFIDGTALTFSLGFKYKFLPQKYK